MEKIIKTEQVTFSYSEEEEQPLVLGGVTLSIEKGTFVAVLGHNGSGKSTLAKHFNAVLVPTEGQVLVYGIDTADEKRIYDIRQKVGMVFQNPDNQIVATVVEEDVAFALENLGVAPPEIRRRVDEALDIVHMQKYARHAPHQLSGGQKQRVAIAGVIAMRPDCIVLDEPTAMLDPKGRQDVLKTVRKLNHENGITVVLITHYMDEAVQADRVIVMDEGKILLDGPPREVFAQVDIVKGAGLDVPQAAELTHLLKAKGVAINDNVLNEQECVDALVKILEEQDVAKH